MITDDKISQRINELVERSKGPWNKYSDYIEFGMNVLTIARSLFSPKHPIVNNLELMISEYCKNPSTRINFPLEKVIGILLSIKSDLEGGYLSDLRVSIRSEVEADFLGQAKRLLDEKLKDPSAMLIGAVLEDALRQLCLTHGVPEGNGIEKMNVPLRNAGVYGLPQQQQLTAWAAIRNKADHGHFDEYTLDEIRLMYQGVTDFIVKYLG